MQSIGMNATHMIAGAGEPDGAATRPSDTARLYAGAVEATPMTMLETRPRAPVLRPFAPGAPDAPTVVSDMLDRLPQGSEGTHSARDRSVA